MSEYQYYEFQAVDRPLDASARDVLRDLSTRAEITRTRFVNVYHWGDFKGDPLDLMERWFDLHLYLSNWGTRVFMMRLPARLVDCDRMRCLLVEGDDDIDLSVAGDNLILSITRGDIESDDFEEDDSVWLEALAPLRADVLSGDWRIVHLIWLMAVETGAVADDEYEPVPGLAPLTGALETFADFFMIDADLVAAAAEGAEMPAPDSPHDAIAALSDSEKTALLVRVAEGDPHVAAELRVQSRRTDPAGDLRTAGTLLARAKAIRDARDAAAAAAAAAERERHEQAEALALRTRLDALIGRGDTVWQEIEVEIQRRNPGGYDRAQRLLIDLRTIAEEGGTAEAFFDRLADLSDRHANKSRFIERLQVFSPYPSRQQLC